MGNNTEINFMCKDNVEPMQLDNFLDLIEEKIISDEFAMI